VAAGALHRLSFLQYTFLKTQRIYLTPTKHFGLDKGQLNYYNFTLQANYFYTTTATMGAVVSCVRSHRLGLYNPHRSY
jgi:hypothetical protein